MLYGDGTFDTSYYGRTAPYLYHLENDESLGLFGIDFGKLAKGILRPIAGLIPGGGTAFDLATGIFSVGGGSGCVGEGPQQRYRDDMTQVMRTQRDAFDRGLPIRLNLVPFSEFRRTAETPGAMQECPELKAQVQAFVSQYDANVTAMRAGAPPPPPVPAVIPGAPTAGPTVKPPGPIPGAAPVPTPAGLPGWVLPVAIGTGTLLFLARR